MTEITNPPLPPPSPILPEPEVEDPSIVLIKVLVLGNHMNLTNPNSGRQEQPATTQCSFLDIIPGGIINLKLAPHVQLIVPHQVDLLPSCSIIICQISGVAAGELVTMKSRLLEEVARLHH